VTRRYPPRIGGAEKVLSYLAGAWADLGVRVSVLTSEDAFGEERSVGGALAVGEQARAGLEVIRLGTSPLRMVGTWQYMRNLASWLRGRRIDLAYVSMLKHDAYVTIGEGRRLGFPVVLRPEGAGATGDVAWQSWGRFGRVIGLRCRRADAFVALGPRIVQEIEESWRRGTMRPWRWGEWFDPTPRRPWIEVLPNGVPVPGALWSARPGWMERPRAIFVGRLAAEKGLDRLIEGWPQVLGEYPRAQLVLIGEGPMREELEARGRAVGLKIGEDGALFMPGAMADVEIWLRSADLFVLPSLEEGMSVALLEAMALGMPVVASAIPGNCALIDDGQHGRLAAAGVDAFARAIVEQWRGFEGACAMGLRARARVEREFSIEATARRHLIFFEEVMRARTRIAP